MLTAKDELRHLADCVSESNAQAILDAAQTLLDEPAPCEHTPGPWKIGSIVPNSELKPADRRNYAGDMAYIWTDRPYPGGVCVAKVKEELMGELKPNAHLIAAAPDLLEALTGLFEHCAMIHKQWGDGDNTREADAAIKTARAAIAKAEGK